MPRQKKLKTITEQGTHLDMLKKLALILAERLESGEEQNLAPLAKQYRETISEIADIEGSYDIDDELGEILSGRSPVWGPGANDTDKTKLN